MTKSRGAITVPTFSQLHYTLPQHITVVLHVTPHTPSTPTPAAATSITELAGAHSPLIHLRDGDVVLFKVPHSGYWQARFKLESTGWLRFSTRQRQATAAAAVACERYDEARFRLRHGLAPELRRFDAVARECIADLQQEIAAGTGRRVFSAYIGVIERYFIPFFG